MRKIIVLFLFFSAGCADMKLCLKDEMKAAAPGKILVSGFCSRDMSYDPFLADEFSEALHFVLFVKGYNVQLIKQEEGKGSACDSPDDAAALCRDSKAAILISGIISRKEAGSFADRTVYYSATFIIRDVKGKIIGQGVYSDKNIDGPLFIREAAESFAADFTRQTCR